MGEEEARFGKAVQRCRSTQLRWEVNDSTRGRNDVRNRSKLQKARYDQRYQRDEEESACDEVVVPSKTIGREQGDEDQMINVSKAMKGIKERRHFLERANLHDPMVKRSLKV